MKRLLDPAPAADAGELLDSTVTSRDGDILDWDSSYLSVFAGLVMELKEHCNGAIGGRWSHANRLKTSGHLGMFVHARAGFDT